VTEQELYPLQDSAASAIASALGLGRARRDEAGLAARRTASPEAHDLVLRGQFLTEQGTEAGLHEAIALFQRAAALDSTYVDPWTGIAQAWFFLADTYIAPREAVPPMRAALDKALALDPESAPAHALRASLLATYLRDYAAAEPEYLRAIALDSTTPFGGDYGWYLHLRGLDDSATAVVRRARRHNPYSFAPTNLAIVIFLDRGMLDSASAACQALRRLSNDRCDANVLMRRGRAAEAVTLLKAPPPTRPEEMLLLSEASARAGDTAAARRELSAALAAAGPRYVREDYVAFVYLALGDTARTLEWLDRGLTAQAANMAWINRNWRFRPLYGNPDFAAILRKAGLQPVP
jgi:Tfp pilus assembly protein PilF